jgi:hypothetical protein
VRAKPHDFLNAIEGFRDDLIVGAKIGNVHLKWAFSEAVLWMLRYSDDAKAFLKRK